MQERMNHSLGFKGLSEALKGALSGKGPQTVLVMAVKKKETFRKGRLQCEMRKDHWF